MMPRGNTRPGVGIFALACLLLICRPSAGQEAGGGGLAYEDGEAAFDWVQDWVRAEEGVPADDQLDNRPVAGVFGVYVTLREDGRVLGRGQALRDDVAEAIDGGGPAVQLAELCAAATRQALDELRDKKMKRAVELGINDPDLFKQALIATRQRVQVDIQIGHSLESIVLPQDGDEAAVFATFAPGFHGLRLSSPLVGEPDYAWPATELSRNTTPIRLMLWLMDKQGYAADDLPLVARADGPALQRFEVMHMVRPGPAQPMRQLIRGNLILNQQVIDARTIDGLAERVARFLDQLVVQDDTTRQIGVRGVYQPSMDRYAPQWAEPRQAALMCYALNRHAKIQFDAEAAGETMRSRVKRVLRLAEQMESDALPEPGKPKHLVAAFLLMALCESPVNLDPAQIALRDRLGQALIDLHHPEGGGFRVMADDDQRLPRASAAVITAALAAWYEQTRDRSRTEPILAVLSDLMQVNQGNDGSRVIDLVWVSHAISKAGDLLAKNNQDPDAAKETIDAWRAFLAEQITLLSEQQVRGKPVLGPSDVTGGFILKSPAPGSPPNPTWESAMPLSIIALGLRDPAVIAPDKIFGPLLTAQLGARFVGQLMVTQPSAYYLRNIDPALGGVRNTLWDNTLYPDCSSMALIALAELQQSLQELEPDQ